MKFVVLDTNIVSFIFKTHRLASFYTPLIENTCQAISFMTISELRFGALMDNWGTEKTTRLETLIGSYVVVHSSSKLCSLWAEIRYQRRAQPIPLADAWIAASALSLNCALVTHNPADFRDIPGLDVVTANSTIA